MRNFFIFDGKDSRDFGLYTNGPDTYKSAQRKLEVISVDGRNGGYVYNSESYEDVRFAYKKCFIKPQNFEIDLAALRSFLGTSGIYKRLEDSYHPDEFYLAYFDGQIEPDMLDNLKLGDFDINMVRLPQRFLKDGERWLTLTSPTTLHNEWGTKVNPLIRVVGAGTLTCGDVELEVAANNASYLDIDSEIMQTRASDGYRNDLVTLNDQMEYPFLGPADTTITFTGFSSVKIMPRWWRL